MRAIYKIRQRNVRFLASKYRTSALFAEAIERVPTMVSRLIGKNAKGVIGDDVALHIEEQLKLTPGSLDVLFPELQENIGTPDTSPGDLTKFIPKLNVSEVTEFLSGKEPVFFQPVDANLPDSCFGVIFQGSSMSASKGSDRPSYNEGTVGIIKPGNSYSNGDVVLAKVVSSNSCIIRNFDKELDEAFLVPSNDTFKSLPVDNDIKLIGVVIGDVTINFKPN